MREIRGLGGGRSELIVAVERADDVAGFPNLLARFAGTELAVSVRTDAVERAGVRDGDVISCRAELTGPRRLVAQPASLVLVD